MTFVELCAGSAAVSLRWLNRGARPPLSWQGGKRGYADQILRALGEAWELWRSKAGRLRTVDRLRAWQKEDPRTLWERLRAAPVPAEVEERVAAWAMLQWWSFARKPVNDAGGSWANASFNAAEAYGGDYEKRYRGSGWAHRNRRLDELAALPRRGSNAHPRGDLLPRSPLRRYDLRLWAQP